jgi:hypothetical protein
VISTPKYLFQISLNQKWPGNTVHDRQNGVHTLSRTWETFSRWHCLVEENDAWAVMSYPRQCDTALSAYLSNSTTETGTFGRRHKNTVETITRYHPTTRFHILACFTSFDETFRVEKA